jgi:hypothetical protein
MKLNAFVLGCVSVLGLVTAGCGDDPLSVGDLVGTWEATTFEIDPAGGGAVIDFLAGGATIDITVAANGTTTGTLFVPAALNGGVALTESMAGSVDLDGNSITFDQAADTFLRDADFSLNGSTLTGTHTDGDGTITVVLTKQ